MENLNIEPADRNRNSSEVNTDFLQEGRVSTELSFADVAQSLISKLQMGRSKISGKPYCNVYDTVREKTSSNIGIAINAIRLNTDGQDMLNDIGREIDLAVLARNESTGKIVGIRDIKITYNSKKHLLVAEGRIAVSEKNKGIAKPVELFLEKILQDIANESGKYLSWSIKDFNLTMLERFVRGNKSATSQKTKEDYEAKKQERRLEHDRWLALYGEGGKLGFKHKIPEKFTLDMNDYYAKTFIPDRKEKIIPANPMEKDTLDAIIGELQECVTTKTE